MWTLSRGNGDTVWSSFCSRLGPVRHSYSPPAPKPEFPSQISWKRLSTSTPPIPTGLSSIGTSSAPPWKYAYRSVSAWKFDALYRHFGYSAGPYFFDKTTTGDLEFPVLVKYRLLGKTHRSFVDAGLAVDTLSGSTQAYGLFLPDMFITNTTSQPNELQNQTILGFVAGGGFDLHVWHLHFLPELRYTRWKDGHFLNSQPTVLTSNRNQVEFLLGITF
jgi:hypothetical protein